MGVQKMPPRSGELARRGECKKGMGGKARGRDARYSARGGIQETGAYFAGSSHHARGACEVSGSAGKRFEQRLISHRNEHSE